MSDDMWPLGVFASCDEGLGLSLDLVRDLGVATVHLHAPRPESRSEDLAIRLEEKLANSDITATCMFAGFEGESYADISATRSTVGLVPEEHRKERIDEFKLISNFALMLGIDVVGMHLGFIPIESQSEMYDGLVGVMKHLCEFCHGKSQSIYLETGQETVATLLAFLRDVDAENLFVNFDPANMILYGVGEPLPALQQLGPYVRSVHCKDAKWSDLPGETWGTEVPLGEGDVGVRAFLQLLHDIGYSGPLTIEREIPHECDRQVREVRDGIELLKELTSQVKGEAEVSS